MDPQDPSSWRRLPGPGEPAPEEATGGEPGPRHPARPAPVELDGGRADRGDGRHRRVFRPGQRQAPRGRPR